MKLALSDVAFAMTANLGRLAQAELGLEPPTQDGNYLYGAFGRDFVTRDGRRVMVVGLTDRQWRALKTATASDGAMAALGAEMNLDLDDEGNRFRVRDRIAAILEPWFAASDYAEIARALSAADVSWGPYRTAAELMVEDERVSALNPMFATVAHPGSGPYLTPASPLDFSSVGRVPPLAAARLGEHTDQILAELLGLPTAQIGRLHDAGIVAGPN